MQMRHVPTPRGSPEGRQRGIPPRQAQRALAPRKFFWSAPPLSGPAPVRKFQKVHKKIKFLKGKCKFWLENSKNHLENVKIARSVRKILNFRPIFRLENFDFFGSALRRGWGHLPPVRWWVRRCGETRGQPL